MEDKLAEQVARMGDLKISYRVLIGQAERKRIIGRRKRKFFAFLESHAALIGRHLRTFRDNISAPSSRVKLSKKNIQWGNNIIKKHCRNRVAGRGGEV